MKRSNINRIGKRLKGPGLECPKCSCVLDGIASAEEKSQLTPRPGDFTVCANCSTILEFAETLSLKFVSDETLIKAAGTPGLKTALETAHFLNKR